jgi:phytoene dehydrogenase-like protein
MTTIDAVVIGAGPNGLAAAVTLARAGLSVEVFERDDTIGGGSRTAELTLPGFRHDLCSAVHPMALASEFFQHFGLSDRIDLALPALSYGHPLDGGRAGLAWHDLDRTAEGLGRDGRAWTRLFRPLVEHADAVGQFTGNSLLRIPRHPITAARFGLRALEQGSPLWNLRFSEDVAPAMLAGIAAHAILPMPSISTAGVALSLGTYAHARGWPIPVGGSQAIVDAMAADAVAHGAVIHTGAAVRSVDELPAHRAAIFDTSVTAMKSIAALPDGYARHFRYGNAAAKVDFALSGPVPWANEHLREAGTLHLGGTRAEIAAGEREVAAGRHPSSPYVLVSQPSTIDSTRAPAGKHVLWAYTHVPAGSTVDCTEIITAQIERFAPGFRDLILASASRTATETEAYNPNYVGGDIAAGAAGLDQLLARPVLRPDPWRTPRKGVYLASSSATPGPGVHGLVGWHAARSALEHEFGLSQPELGSLAG